MLNGNVEPVLQFDGNQVGYWRSTCEFKNVERNPFNLIRPFKLAFLY